MIIDVAPSVLSEELIKLYHRLRDYFGFLNWWPGDSPYEVIVGALLTQNTSWVNVEKAILNLKASDNLNPARILELQHERLGEYIRPSGYYNQKARRLKVLTSWFLDTCNGDVSLCQSVSTEKLRVELLELNGVGPETADSILLYAFERQIFVIDTYTRRSLSRIGFTKESSSYDELQSIFMTNMPQTIDMYKDYHAQLVYLGKNFCHPKPLCGTCPVQNTCQFGSKGLL